MDSYSQKTSNKDIIINPVHRWIFQDIATVSQLSQAMLPISVDIETDN